MSFLSTMQFSSGLRLSGNAMTTVLVLMLWTIGLCPSACLFAATIDLATLLNGSESTVSLDAADTYVLYDEYRVTTNKTIYCNDAAITEQGPLKVMGSGVQLTLDHCHIDSSSWGAVASVNGANLNIADATISCTSGTAVYVSGATTVLARVDINSSTYGVNIDSGGTVTASTLTVTDCPYAIQATGSGSSISLDDCHLEYDKPGTTAIGIMLGASATIRSTTISGFGFGVNVNEGNSATIESTSIENCPYAVQVLGSTSSVSLDNGCALTHSGAGTGIGLLQGARGTVRDTTITGFSNGIDLQPPVPVGWVEIYGCRFVNNNVSALSAVGASDILCSDSLVEGAKADGIYFENTSGTIDRCYVTGSLNTGVSFVGCSDGAILSNSIITQNAHQGVAVAKDDDSDDPSRNIQILDNTISNNTLGDIFVDQGSHAIIIGNVLTGSPGANLKLHGCKQVTCDANLIMNSDCAFEIKDQATCDITLSHFENFTGNGILIYGGSSMALEHSVVGPASAGYDSYGIFVNESATAVVNYNDMGDSGDYAFYNNAGTWCDVTNNYWGSSDGPTVMPAGGTGSGSVLDWNVINGSNVSYEPFLAEVPVACSINSSVNISPGDTLTWNSQTGLQLAVTTQESEPPVASEIVGVLRAYDTKHLDKIWPAPAMLEGQLYAVWLTAPVREASESIVMTFFLPGDEPPLYLVKRDADGFWTSIPATWTATAHKLTATLTDGYLANGIFALSTAEPPSREEMREMITHFYETILGREPEPGAVDAWEKGYFAYALSFDIDVRYIPSEMGRLFFLSEEYQNRNRSDEEFITDCYHAFLYRDPEPGVIDQWLSGEWNRAEAMSLFAESDEFKNHVQQLFPGFSGDGIRNLVTSLYIGLLDRLADKGGLIYWSDQFEASGDYPETAKIMGKAVVASQEFQDFQPSEEDIVVRLYRGYLGRFPNDNEIAYWSELLNNGTYTTDQLIDLFAESEEFQDRIDELVGVNS